MFGPGLRPSVYVNINQPQRREDTCRSEAQPARWSPVAWTQFDCLHAGYLPAFRGKSQQGSDDVPSIVAAGAGIHVNESERLVAHYFHGCGSGRR